MERRNLNILLVEDNPGDARLIQEMLRETGYAGSNLVPAPTLRHALTVPIEPVDVELVLLDLNLPDSMGLRTLDDVLSAYGSSAIIVLTGMEDEALAEEALRHGAQNYLIKGHIDPTRLERELRYAVERHVFTRRLREADVEIASSERRFRSLVEYSSDLTLTLDPVGRVTYASPAVHRLFGIVRNGIHLLDLLEPEDRTEAEHWLNESLEHHERPVPLVVRAACPEGGYYTLEGTVTNLTQFKGVAAVVVNLHDVTRRELAMQEIVSERNSKKALINSTTDMIWSVDRDMHLITANRWFVSRIKELADFDVAPGASIVPSISLGSYDSERWRGYYMRALDGESFVTEEHTGGSEPLWGEFTFNPIVEGGAITGVACSCRNITKRKRAEQHIRILNGQLEQRVEERTRQVQESHTVLEQQVVKNQALSDDLALRNRDLLDSMVYARRIQDALFPATDGIPFFRRSACLSLPRDVVSGDFCWYHDTPERIYLAIADCTGHGVPGALMSMLGHSLLDQLVTQRQLTDPAEVLRELDRALHTLFNKHTGEERIQDGMDIGLLAVDKGTRMLQFGGAQLGCMLLRDGALEQLPIARVPVGGHIPPNTKYFVTAQQVLHPGDRLILATDGYRSQFGGPNGRKLNGPYLREILLNTAQLSPVQTTATLATRFRDWQGGHPQVDDVLVVVVDV